MTEMSAASLTAAARAKRRFGTPSAGAAGRAAAAYYPAACGSAARNNICARSATSRARHAALRARHVPAVGTGAPDQPVAGARQEAVRGEIGDVVLDQKQPRPPARQIEPGQHFDLVAFDVDRDKIDRRRRVRPLREYRRACGPEPRFRLSATTPVTASSRLSEECGPETCSVIAVPALAGDEQAAATT